MRRRTTLILSLALFDLARRGGDDDLAAPGDSCCLADVAYQTGSLGGGDAPL